MPSFRQRAYDCIRQRLLSGELPAGSRVSDASLAQEIGVSRTPIREAIHQLRSEGLIEQIPRRGAFVRRMGRQDIEDLFELREVLESYAAGRAARCMDEEGLRSLGEKLRELRELGLQVRRRKLTRFEGRLAHRWVENDVAFHLQIVRAAGNRSLLKAVEELRMISHVFGRQRFLPEETPLAQLAWTYRHHSRIASAIARRDAQAAARFAADHAARARVNALVRFDWQQRREQDAGDHGVWPASVAKRIRQAERRQTSRRRPARPGRSRP